LFLNLGSIANPYLESVGREEQKKLSQGPGNENCEIVDKREDTGIVMFSKLISHE